MQALKKCLWNFIYKIIKKRSIETAPYEINLEMWPWFSFQILKTVFGA